MHFYVSILSERLKKNKFSSFLRGTLIGLISNLKAIYTGEFFFKNICFRKISALKWF